MTDRLNGVWVAFDRDIRTDDAEMVINAIRCIRGVCAVEPNVTEVSDYLARARVREELGTKVLDLFREIMDPNYKKKD